MFGGFPHSSTGRKWKHAEREVETKSDVNDADVSLSIVSLSVCCCVCVFLLNLCLERIMRFVCLSYDWTHQPCAFLVHIYVCMLKDLSWLWWLTFKKKKKEFTDFMIN